jgi:hypothetical protein
MSQPMDFDRFVSDWLKTDGLADIRAETVERAVATARATRPRRGLVAALIGPAPWPSYGRRIGFGTLPPALRIAIAVTLLVVLAAGAAFVGSQILRSLVPSRPPAAHSFVVTRGSSPCSGPSGGTTSGDGVTMIDFESGATRPLVECENALLLSPDGIHAAAASADGLALIDLRDGSRQVVPSAMGPDVVPVQWSPTGAYLYWVEGIAAGEPEEIFLGSIEAPRRTTLPVPTEGGYYCCVTWSADESNALFQTPGGSGWSVGNGDGSDLRALGPDYTSVLAISPDGSRLAVRLARPGPVNLRLYGDVAVGDGVSTPRAVTHLPEGTLPMAAAWSPDGSTLAVLSNGQPGLEIPRAPQSRDVWLIAADGSTRDLTLPLDAEVAWSASGSVRWSPDGSHLVVGWQTVRSDGQQEIHHERFVIVSVADGALTPSDGWVERPADEVFFSPDGRRVAYHADGSLEVLDLDGPGRWSIQFTDVAPLGWGGQLVWLP